ncbi:uncharacterized protein [Elaeis guineensis]|uniref:uncharacterized protein n=1 Tax=Elaeis guineensis var. tenera TaxID=51953 RepID=UPI003C6D0C38
MTITRSPLNSNMQQPRVRTPGWAAFDRKQRAKDGNLPECDADPFPSISNITSSGSATSLETNNSTSMKSFSSVVRPHVKCPLFVNDQKSGLLNDNSGGRHLDDQVTAENNVNPAVKMLKDLHSWADQNLIKDVLAAVNDDVDQASVLLKAMVSPDSKIEKTSCSDLISSISTKDKFSGENLSIDNKLSDGADEVLISRKDPSIFVNDNTKFSVESMPVKNKQSDSAHEALIPRRLSSVPAEPEWEENDVYLSHRKDAIKMVRVASQHSRAASNAYLRGDHVSARQLSLRAQGERMAAEKLNMKAAETILSIRNNNNDIWKIDLHGLHASEAVSALKVRLHKIESQAIMSRSASSDELVKLEAGTACSESLETTKSWEEDSDAKKVKALPQQRQTVLHVITGTGNHSRGQASLPTVVRSFLIENGYHFDDARPGVIAIRPKFRHK